MNADYHPRFVNSVIEQFNEKCNGNTQDDYIIHYISLKSLNR